MPIFSCNLVNERSFIGHSSKGTNNCTTRALWGFFKSLKRSTVLITVQEFDAYP